MRSVMAMRVSHYISTPIFNAPLLPNDILILTEENLYGLILSLDIQRSQHDEIWEEIWVIFWFPIQTFVWDLKLCVQLYFFPSPVLQHFRSNHKYPRSLYSLFPPNCFWVYGNSYLITQSLAFRKHFTLGA